MLQKPRNRNRICRFYLPRCFCFIFACRRANTDKPDANGKSFKAVPAESSRLSSIRIGSGFREARNEQPNGGSRSRKGLTNCRKGRVFILALYI